MTVVESENVAASVADAAAAAANSTNAKKEIDSKINAYEREPVPEDKLYGYFYFFGLFTSTHTAGTEFATYLGLTKYWVKKGWINYDEVSKSKRSTALVEEGSDEADPSEGANEEPMESTDVA